MSISLVETYLCISKICEKIYKLEEDLEKCEKDKKEEIEKKIKKLEEEIGKFKQLFITGQLINDIPDYQDNREGCKYCSGCKYCQKVLKFEISDEI